MTPSSVMTQVAELPHVPEPRTFAAPAEAGSSASTITSASSRQILLLIVQFLLIIPLVFH